MGPLAVMLARIEAMLRVGPTPQDIAAEHPALVKTPDDFEPTHYTTWGWHPASACDGWPECPEKVTP